MTKVSIDIAIQTEDFSSAQRDDWSSCDNNKNFGAVASFIGKVRPEQHPEAGALLALELEHYTGMTEQSLRAIGEQAATRWSIIGCRVVHRVGKLVPGDNIVLVSVCSAHRSDAFAACEFIMDYLKTQAPLWKKSVYENGEYWVEARDSDQLAADKWRLNKPLT